MFEGLFVLAAVAVIIAFFSTGKIRACAFTVFTVLILGLFYPLLKERNDIKVSRGNDGRVMIETKNDEQRIFVPPVGAISQNTETPQSVEVVEPRQETPQKEQDEIDRSSRECMRRLPAAYC